MRSFSESKCTRRQILLVLLGLFLLTAGLRWRLLAIPFERDEGEYAYIAWRLSYNELPYRDWVDQKPPAIFWVYRAALSLPLNSIRAVHFSGLLFAAASSGALFFLALRFFRIFWAGAAAAIFTILAADPMIQGTAANTELFMLLPLILSVIVLFRAAEGDRPRIVFMILAGALTGVAILFKQVAGVNWFFLIGIYPLLLQGKRWQRSVAFTLWSGIGLAAVLGGVALYFWSRNGLSDLVSNVFTHNLEYVSAVPMNVRLAYLQQTLGKLAQTQIIIWIFAAAGLVALLIQKSAKEGSFLLAWLGTSLIGVSASGYFFPHYFQQTLPVLTVLAVGGARWVANLRWLDGVPLLVRRAACALVLASLPAIVLYRFIVIYTPAEAVQKIYPGNLFAEMPALGQRLAEITSPDARVYIFGAEAELLFYARRVSATRYIFLFPLYGPYRDAREKQIAVTEEILRAEPSAGLYMPNALFKAPGTEQYLTRWSTDYFNQQFRPDTFLTVDGAGAYHLSPAKNGQGDVPPDQRAFGALLVKNRE